MKKYECYYDTLIPWCPRLPVSWRLVPNKVIFHMHHEVVGQCFSNYALLSLTTAGIRKKDINDRKGKVPTSYGGYQLVHPDDMVFCLFDLDCSAVFSGRSKYDGMITSAYDVAKVDSKYMSSNFADYWFSFVFSQRHYKMYAKNVRYTITTDIFGALKTPVPPRGEQDQIVRYLDWQMSRINTIIAAKRKQIALLIEQRGALIDKAVLHGVDGCPQKDSGIYWLKQIPEHWKRTSLKRICQVNSSIAHLVKGMADAETVTFIPMENVSVTGVVNYSIQKPFSEVRSGFSSFAKNDVVVAKITPCFENGKGACLDGMDTGIGYGSTEFINLRASEKVLPKYLYMITMTRPFRKLGEELMTGSAGQKRIPVSFLKNFTLGVPAVDEQKRILCWLNNMLMAIDKAIRTAERSIDVLHEFRTRLISDVVTGRIDVRDAVIPEYGPIEEEAGDVEFADDELGGSEVEQP